MNVKVQCVDISDGFSLYSSSCSIILLRWLLDPSLRFFKKDVVPCKLYAYLVVRPSAVSIRLEFQFIHSSILLIVPPLLGSLCIIGMHASSRSDRSRRLRRHYARGTHCRCVPLFCGFLFTSVLVLG